MSQPAASRAPRHKRSRHGRAVVLAAVACLALVPVGCGRQQTAKDPTQAASTPSSDPPTPTTSATSNIYAAPADAYVKPTRPTSLDGPPSEDAAIAFAEYYVRMYTYAYLTGDATDLNALGRTGCVFCANVAADIAREYGSGGHDEGGVMTIDSVRSHDYGVDGTFGVDATGRQAPNREVGADGAVVKESGRERSFTFDFALNWTSSDGWKLGDLGVRPT